MSNISMFGFQSDNPALRMAFDQMVLEDMEQNVTDLELRKAYNLSELEEEQDEV